MKNGASIRSRPIRFRRTLRSAVILNLSFSKGVPTLPTLQRIYRRIPAEHGVENSAQTIIISSCICFADADSWCLVYRGFPALIPVPGI